MSDTMDAIISKPITLDYLTPMSTLAQIAQQQQQTKLLQQQTQGAALANQLSGLKLGVRGAMFAPLLNGQASGTGALPAPTGGAGALPQAVGGTAQAQGSGYLPAPSGASGSLPPAAQEGSGNQATPAASGAAGLPPAYTHSPGMPPPGQLIGQQISPSGVQTAYGVPIPIGRLAAAGFADDPNSGLHTAMEDRRVRMYELLSQPDWNQGVTQAYQEGWMDPQHYQAWINNPSQRAAALATLVDPAKYQDLLEKYSGHGMTLQNGQAVASPAAIGALGATAASEALGKATAETTTIPQQIGVDKAGNPIYAPTAVNKAALATATLGAGQSGAVAAGPSNIIASALHMQESGGAASSPTSVNGAQGGWQITPPFWKQYSQPGENIANPADNQAVAQRGIADLSQKYNNDPARVAVGYFSGPSNVAPPGSPTPWVNNTKDGNGTTVAQYVSGVMNHLGNAAPAAGVGGAAVPGIAAGPQILSPQQGAALEVQKAGQTAQVQANVKALTDYKTGLAGDASKAVENNTLVDQMRTEGTDFDHGSFTDAWQGIKKDFGSVAQALGGTMPDTVGSWEAFNKNAGQLARSAASQLSSQVGFNELRLVQKYLPSAEMSNQAFARVADQIQGLNDYKVAKNAAAEDFQGTPAQFEKQWNSSITPTAFIVHRMSAADAATLATSLKQTPEGKVTWQHILDGAKYADANGLFAAGG